MFNLRLFVASIEAADNLSIQLYAREYENLNSFTSKVSLVSMTDWTKFKI